MKTGPRRVNGAPVFPRLPQGRGKWVWKGQVYVGSTAKRFGCRGLAGAGDAQADGKAVRAAVEMVGEARAFLSQKQTPWLIVCDRAIPICAGAEGGFPVPAWRGQKLRHIDRERAHAELRLDEIRGLNGAGVG